MRPALYVVVVAATAILIAASNVFAQPEPEFKLSFKAMADRIPGVVAGPSKTSATAHGDFLQRTSTGLIGLALRDNDARPHHGYRTWIDGP